MKPAACRWFERWHYLTSPIGHEGLEKKLKSCSISDCNGSRFCTPPEICRKTSTPVFIGQNGFETPCVPEFSLKTPKTNSPSIAQIASISKTQTSSDTQFFSFLLHASNEELTPFRTGKDEQFPRNNSGRKLTVVEEKEKTAYRETEKIIVNAIEMSSPVNVDLTTPNGGILQDSPKSDDVHEDAVKKVRFSDQDKIAVGKVENLMESCVRTILNTSDEDEFHDAYDETNMQKAKSTEDIKGASNTVDTNDEKDTCTVKEIRMTRNTNDSRAEDKKRVVISSENFLNNSQIKITLDDTKNREKEKRDPEVSKEGTSTNQRDSNTILMMVLVESNSGGATNDLMPLISSGLKKLQEQLLSTRCQSSAAESAKVCRRSITTMKMSVSSVESYSANNATAMTNRGQLASSSSSSSVQSDENSNNGGFLSAVAQVMKHALRSLSGQ